MKIKWKLFLIPALFFVGACATTPQVVEKPVLVSKPALIVPEIPPVNAYPLSWVVITKSNADQKLKDLETKVGPSVTLYIAITPDGYQNLSLTIEELRNYIEKQKNIIDAYKVYYESPGSDDKSITTKK